MSDENELEDPKVHLDVDVFLDEELDPAEAFKRIAIDRADCTHPPDSVEAIALEPECYRSLWVCTDCGHELDGWERDERFNPPAVPDGGELQSLEEPSIDGRALREIELGELEIGDIVIVSYRDEQGDQAHFRGRVDHVNPSDDPFREITWIDVSGDGDEIRVMFGGGVFALDEGGVVDRSIGYIAHVELEVDL